MSDWVGNPEDWFSRVAAKIVLKKFSKTTVDFDVSTDRAPRKSSHFLENHCGLLVFHQKTKYMYLL